MNPSFSKLNVLLGKVQSALGTKQSSLTSSDFRTVGEDFSLDYVNDFKEQSLAQGIFGQPQKIKGVQSIDVKVTLPVIPTGGASTPNVHDFLRCCGMAYTLSTYEHQYAPSSAIATDWKDMTLWGYTGDKTAGQSQLTKAHSVMFDSKLSWAIGEALMAEFTGKGVPDGVPAPASYVSGTLALLSDVPPAFLKSTYLSIVGEDYCVLKGELNFGNQIELVKCTSDASGFIRSTIKGRTTSFAMTVYQDIAAANPLSDMDGEVLDELKIRWGVTDGSLIEIGSTAKAQITSVKNGKDGDLNTYELAGYFVDNDWYLHINVSA